MTPTVICNGPRQLNGGQFLHAEEIPPDFLPPEMVDYLLDKSLLQECPDRRSLYRLLPAFSGARERELISKDELTTYALPQ